jgi:hypothetical protein
MKPLSGLCVGCLAVVDSYSIFAVVLVLSIASCFFGFKFQLVFRKEVFLVNEKHDCKLEC